MFTPVTNICPCWHQYSIAHGCGQLSGTLRAYERLCWENLSRQLDRKKETATHVGDHLITRWLSRSFEESGICLLGELFLSSLENSLAEEIEAASTIHLPLQELQAMHLTLDLTLGTNCQLHLMT
jgi:hypothetical protein